MDTANSCGVIPIVQRVGSKEDWQFLELEELGLRKPMNEGKINLKTVVKYMYILLITLSDAFIDFIKFFIRKFRQISTRI
ncbi:MAG: hypothetical protein V7K24_07380 [Nostoc sp.]